MGRRFWVAASCVLALLTAVTGGYRPPRQPQRRLPSTRPSRRAKILTLPRQERGPCHDVDDRASALDEASLMGVLGGASRSWVDEWAATGVVLGVVALGVALVTVTAAPEEAAAAQTAAVLSSQEILQKALRRAVGGGVSGAAASIIQVFSLMWLRTIMNWQYRYGLTLQEAAQRLYAEGGIARFYQGLPLALLQVPLSRFGDVAANAFVLLLLDSLESTKGLPLPVKTALGSVGAGVWRWVFFPVDTLKTSLQVKGQEGLQQVRQRLDKEGVRALYQGSIAAAVATAAGHWPYFATFNVLSERFPAPPSGELFQSLLRNALIGLCSSTISDCVSNSIRVIKTRKQTAETEISYQDALSAVLAEGGVRGLLGRGLGTRLLTNGLQGMLFAVVWKYLEKQVFQSWGA